MPLLLLFLVRTNIFISHPAVWEADHMVFLTPTKSYLKVDRHVGGGNNTSMLSHFRKVTAEWEEQVKLAISLCGPSFIAIAWWDKVMNSHSRNYIWRTFSLDKWFPNCALWHLRVTGRTHRNTVKPLLFSSPDHEHDHTRFQLLLLLLQGAVDEKCESSGKLVNHWSLDK